MATFETDVDTVVSESLGWGPATPIKSDCQFNLNEVSDPSLLKVLQSLDKNGDGVLSLEEVVRGARDLRTAQANMKLLKQLLGSMFVMLLLIIGIVGGLTAYIVAENQISKYDSTNNQLLNKANDQPATVATSMTRIPLGALYLFPDSLPLLKDVSYRDPFTDSLHVKTVYTAELSAFNLLTIVTTDKMMIQVNGIEASFSYNTYVPHLRPSINASNSTTGSLVNMSTTSAMFNITTAKSPDLVVSTVSFSICSACSSCASHSFPTTPEVTERLEKYYSTIDKCSCAVAFATNAPPPTLPSIAQRRREMSANMAPKVRRSRGNSGRTSMCRECVGSMSALPPPPPPPPQTTDVVFANYFSPWECESGCATWSNLARDGNTKSQAVVNAKWKDPQLLANAGSSCAQPFYDQDARPWCYCKNNEFTSWGYCRLSNTKDQLFPDYLPVGGAVCTNWINVALQTSAWFRAFESDFDFSPSVAQNYCAQPANAKMDSPYCYAANIGVLACAPIDQLFPTYSPPSSTCPNGCKVWGPETSQHWFSEKQRVNAKSTCAQPYYTQMSKPWCFCNSRAGTAVQCAEPPPPPTVTVTPPTETITECDWIQNPRTGAQYLNCVKKTVTVPVGGNGRFDPSKPDPIVAGLLKGLGVNTAPVGFEDVMKEVAADAFGAIAGKLTEKIDLPETAIADFVDTGVSETVKNS